MEESTGNATTETTTSENSPVNGDNTTPIEQNVEAGENLTLEEFEELEAYGKKYKLSKPELKKMAQKGLGADAAFRKAKAERDQATQVLRAIQESPFEILKHIHGDKLRDMMEEYVYNNLKQDQMSPEEKKMLADQARLKEYEEKERKRNEEEMTAKQQQAVEHYKQVYTQKIGKSLELAGLPKTEEAARRALGYYQKAFTKGIQIDPQTVGELVKEDYDREIGGNLGELDGDALMAMLGEKTVEKISKALLKKHQTKNSGFMPPSRQPEPRQTESAPKRHYITEDEWDSAKRGR